MRQGGTQLSTQPPIFLQPPGAGLPFLELTLSRIGFWIHRQLSSRDGALAQFGCEAEIILALSRSLEPSWAATPVLIPRVWGIEDSSRNWSVLMVLEHLVIVNAGIAVIVEHLAACKTFPGEVSTIGVKPTPVTDPATIERFAVGTRDYAARIVAVNYLRTGITHRHPWFGELDAHGWNCLAAAHQAIHRRQVERILRLLPKNKNQFD